MNNHVALRLLFRGSFLQLALVVTFLSAIAHGGTKTVTVPANPLWTDTGVAVSAGQVISISASGTWNWGRAPSDFGPDGDPSDFTNGYDQFQFFDNFEHGRLLAFIGTDPLQGQWGNGSFFPNMFGYFSIGSGQTFAAPYGGELWLGMNDDAVTEQVSDNTGQLTAIVTVGSTDTTAPAIKITSPSKVYLQSQKISAKYACTDPSEPVASCTGTVANGARVDTSSTGPQQFTVVAVDDKGNSTSERLAYFVGNVGLAPQRLTFTPQLMGSTSKAQTVTLYNPQSSSLSISGIEAGSGFGSTTTCGATLGEHKHCTIRVTFQPNISGDILGSLDVSTSAGSPSIDLAGFGTPVELSPTSVKFAKQSIHTTSPAKNVTLKNGETVSLNVKSINLTGDFALAPATTCPASGSLAAGANCKIAITFTPTVTGKRTGTLILETDYPTAPVIVQLSGTGD